MKSMPKLPKLTIGYSSHGEWSTLGNLREIELERGNDFPKLPCPDSTPAIWVCKTKRKAARYLALAEEWERLDSNKPLTPELKELVEGVTRVPFKRSDRVVLADNEDGYLVVRGCRIKK